MEVVIKDVNNMPASSKEISLFLTAFKKQAKANGLVYYNWEENLQELLFLEITARRREQIILRLRAEDCVEGPFDHETNEEVECWAFQIEVKEKQVQIEISLADDLGAACCYVFAAS